MVAVTYTSDLTDITLFESITGVLTYNTGGGGGAPEAGIDYAIEGTNAVGRAVNNTERGFLFQAGGNFTIGADDHFYIWVVVGTYGLADTRNNRGICVAIGDDAANFVQFHVNGGDTLPLGGMVPYAVRYVNTALTNLRTLVGSPSTTPDSIGCTAVITGTAKFENLAADACRIGTGYDILNGTGADPEGNFAGIAADDVSTREGVLTPVAGGYNLQGKLRIGSSTTAAEFLDSNINVNITDTPHSAATFSEILVENAASVLTLTNITFTAIGTNNPGRFEMITSAATCNLTGVGFVGFGASVLGTGATFTTCRWIGSDVITANGANLNGSSIKDPNITANTSGLIWNVATDPDGLLDDMSFTMGSTATHAIEFGTSSPTSITLRGIDFSGYSATDNQNDSTFDVKRTSGTVTINLVGCTGNFSARTAGATVNIVNNPVTIQVTCVDATGTAVSGVRVLLETAAAGAYPYQDSVTITQSAGTATVTHTSHGLATNDFAVISGANEADYNGVNQITVTGTNSYTYSVDAGTASPATGTIISSYAPISAVTGGTGIVSTSKVFASDQAVSGVARKGTSTPLYKTAPISGTVSSTSGLSQSAVMISDE